MDIQIQRHVNIHLRDMDIIIISQLSDLSQPANCSVPVEYNTNNKLSRLTFWSIRELQVSAVIDPFIYGSERILRLKSSHLEMLCYYIPCT